jgi:cytochrome c-type biogenesis protein CcmE
MNANPKINDIVRIGGFVMKESINKIGTNIYNFTITDHKELLYVTYDGVLPDLFREEQGVVVEGKIIKNKHLKAISVFAKHDENYIPASIKSQLKNNEYWKKDYK